MFVYRKMIKEKEKFDKKCSKTFQLFTTLPVSKQAHKANSRPLFMVQYILAKCCV